MADNIPQRVRDHANAMMTAIKTAEDKAYKELSKEDQDMYFELIFNLITDWLEIGDNYGD